MVKKYNQNKYFHNILFLIIITLSIIKTSYSICNQNNCPPNRGYCRGNECICEPNFITLNNAYVKNNGVYCNYKVKSRYMAFLLEFFFPFGIGHFYSGNTVLAIIKLALFIFLLTMCCSVLCCVVGKVLSACSAIICILVLLSIIGLVFMEVFDLISYGLGFYYDGNGVKMS